MSTFLPDELRIISVSAPVWLKMLRRREDKVLNKIYGAFKNGDTVQTANLAEFCTIRDQIHEITTSLREQDPKQE